MSEQYPYCTVYNGIKVCSNYPLNQQPPPSHYKIDIHFKLPFLNYIGWADLEVMLSFQNFINALSQALGYTPKITNYKVYASGNYDLYIEFDASSPIPLIVWAVIIGLIALIVWLIDYGIIQLTQLGKTTGGSILLAGFGIAIVLLGLSLLFGRRKKKRND